MKIPHQHAPGTKELGAPAGRGTKSDPFEAILRAAGAKRPAPKGEEERSAAPSDLLVAQLVHGVVPPPPVQNTGGSEAAPTVQRSAAENRMHGPVRAPQVEAPVPQQQAPVPQQQAHVPLHQVSKPAEQKDVPIARLPLVKRAVPAEIRRLSTPTDLAPTADSPRRRSDRAAESKRAAASEAPAMRPEPNASAQPTGAAEMQPPTPPPAPTPTVPQPPPPQRLAMPEPVVVWHPSGAQLRINTGDTGPLSVRIDVRDGAADLRVSGPAAPILGGNTAELRTALAAEGLRLGDLDLGSNPGGGHGADRDPDEPPPSRRDRTAPPTNRRRGTIDVEA